MKTALLVIASALAVSAIDSPATSAKVQIETEKGSFQGELNMEVSGTLEKAKIKWQGSVRNVGARKVFRATLCVKAYGAAGLIAVAGQDCTLNLFGSNWDPATSLTFKGDQNAKLGIGKDRLQVTRFEVTAPEILDHSPNVRQFEAKCASVWPIIIRTFADRRFRPTVIDKDSLLATFAYDGGIIEGYRTAEQQLKAFTLANTKFLGPNWQAFRIDAASVYLTERPDSCDAELKMAFAGFGTAFGARSPSWYAIESNFNFEKLILDDLAQRLQPAK